MRAIVGKYSSSDPRTRCSVDGVGAATTDTVGGGGGVFTTGLLRGSNDRGDAPPKKRRKKENIDEASRELPLALSARANRSRNSDEFSREKSRTAQTSTNTGGLSRRVSTS